MHGQRWCLGDHSSTKGAAMAISSLSPAAALDPDVVVRQISSTAFSSDRASPACSSPGSPRCGAVHHRCSIALWDLLFLQILLVCSSPVVSVRCGASASGRSLCDWPRCPLQIAGGREEVLCMACCSSWWHSSAARFVHKSAVLFFVVVVHLLPDKMSLHGLQILEKENRMDEVHCFLYFSKR